MVYDCIKEALPLRHHRLAPFSKALYLTPLLLAAFHHGRMGRHALCSLNAEGLNKYNLQKIEYANGRPIENSCSSIIERVSLLVKTPKESENFRAELDHFDLPIVGSMAPSSVSFNLRVYWINQNSS
jgi:hypothetical protein